jgi:Ni,Fe-hydrogenase I small subunit
MTPAAERAAQAASELFRIRMERAGAIVVCGTCEHWAVLSSQPNPSNCQKTQQVRTFSMEACRHWRYWCEHG